MESAILGGLVAYVRKHHPDKPTPTVYRSDALLEDARRLRGQFGDAQFFAKLNEGRTAGDGWGDISEKWDATSFEHAATAQDSAEHRRLVGDLVDRYFTNVRENAHGFIDLDKGLSVISQHAKMLGYHGLILFLDELILWLASHAADINFLNREGTKLPKLVEAQHADRPAPIISFIARQRDLRELVGDHIAGSLQLGFSDILRFWEARFSTIKLEDRNLPAIAAQTNRSFYLHGTAVTPGVEKLENELELREEKLPSESAWKPAQERAGHIFGFAASPLLNAGNLAKFCGDLRQSATTAVPKAEALLKQLRGVPAAFINGDPTTTARQRTAVEAAAVLKLIGQHDGAALVEHFGATGLAATPAALGTSISSAADVTAALQGMSWDILEGMQSATGEHAATAASILQNVAESLANDEHVNPLPARLHDAQKAAVALLKAMAAKPAPPIVPPAPAPTPSPIVQPTNENEIVLCLPPECSALLAKHRDVQIDLATGTLTISATGQKFKLRLVPPQK